MGYRFLSLLSNKLINSEILYINAIIQKHIYEMRVVQRLSVKNVESARRVQVSSQSVVLIRTNAVGKDIDPSDHPLTTTYGLNRRLELTHCKKDNSEFETVEQTGKQFAIFLNNAWRFKDNKENSYILKGHSILNHAKNMFKNLHVQSFLIILKYFVIFWQHG